MRDNELIAVVGQTLAAASQMAGWNYGVTQVQGPTQQGATEDPNVLFQKLFDEPWGWPEEKMTYKAATSAAESDSFIESSVQTYQTTFQISALVQQIPDDTSRPTASDVVNYMKMYMGSRHVVSQLQKLGVSVYRVSHVRNEYFEDDKHRNEAHPTFDIVFTHKRQIDFTVGAAHVVEGEVVHVPDNPIVP